jgi:type VI secretion system protein
VNGLRARLRSAGSPARLGDHVALLYASVLDHVRELCSTRQGTVLAQPDYGLPDLVDLTHDELHPEQRIREALFRAITKFEPRLTRVRVLVVPSADPLHLRFQIVGVLLVEGRGLNVNFETRVKATREITVG